MKDHVRSPQIGPVCLAIIRGRHPNCEQYLNTLLDRNSNRDVRGHASFALGVWLKTLSEEAGVADADEKSRKAEELLQKAVDRYADVRVGTGTLAEAVKPQLHELRTLGIGKEAPEIEGSDSAGKKFKLSDYRGKVVVLEFWFRH